MSTTTHNLKPCKFHDASGDVIWDGFAEGTTWNGFDNVSVTPETFDKMIAHWREETPGGDDTLWIDEIVAEYGKAGENGLISLGGGLCMNIIDEPVKATFCHFRADGDDTIWPGFDLGTTTPNAGNNVMVTNTTWQKMIVKWAEDEVIIEHVLNLQKEFTADKDGMVNLTSLNITVEPMSYPQADLMRVTKEAVDAWTAWGASDKEPEHINQGRGLVYGVPLLSQGCYVMVGFEGKLYVAPMKNDGSCDVPNWGLCEDMTEAKFITDVNMLLNTFYKVRE